MSEDVKVNGHMMQPGSHERPEGPTCVCGSPWSWWLDRCDAISQYTALLDSGLSSHEAREEVWGHE